MCYASNKPQCIKCLRTSLCISTIIIIHKTLLNQVLKLNAAFVSRDKKGFWIDKAENEKQGPVADLNKAQMI